MSLRKLFVNLQLTVQFQSGIRRCFASKPKDIVESAEEEPIFLEELHDDIDSKRNKSRLSPQHRNILFDRKPYDESLNWFHDTVKYKRRILGRYGMEALGVPAGLAWPTLEELEDTKEYERIAFPLTLEERWQKIKDKHRMEEEAIITRQNEIDVKMSKMNELIAEVEAKVAKKKAEAEEAKKKKERRLLEIRRQLHVAGHVTNDKINEMMEKLEKEDKKKRKEAKKQRFIERQKQLVMTNMPIETNTKAGKNEASEDKEGSPTVEEPMK